MMGFLSLIPLKPVPWPLYEHIVPTFVFAKWQQLGNKVNKAPNVEASS